MMVWLGNGGSKPPACPASVPTVSTPTAQHVALVRQQARRRPGGSRECAGRLPPTLRNVRGVGALAPVGAQQHPGARRNAAVLTLPRQDALGCQQEVGVRRRLARHVDHAGRADEAAGGNRVAGVVGQILAGDPVHRRVEVRAGVLAQRRSVFQYQPGPCSS